MELITCLFYPASSLYDAGIHGCIRCRFKSYPPPAPNCQQIVMLCRSRQLSPAYQTILSQVQYLRLVHIATRSSLSISVAVFHDTVGVLARCAKKIVVLAQHNQAEWLYEKILAKKHFRLAIPRWTEEPAETLLPMSFYHLRGSRGRLCLGNRSSINPDHWHAGTLACPAIFYIAVI